MLLNLSDLETLFYDSPILLDHNKSRIKVYKQGKFRYERIILKTPRCQLAYEPKNNKFNTLAISLQPMNKDLKEFVSFFKKIDKKNKQTLKSLNPKIKYKSCIMKTKYSTKIAQFTIFENCPIYSKSKKKKNLTDLSLENEVSMFLELNYIWIDGVKSGCNWKIIQLKYYSPEFNVNKCMFLSDTEESDNEEDDIKIPNKKDIKYVEKCSACHNISYCTGPSESHINIPPRPPPLPTINTQLPIRNIPKSNIITDKPKQKVFIPSVKDILNIKNRLKKSQKTITI
ncbi:hypothetical protein CPAV1605_1123 [seawater metagenome]|uniref:Uncharacterized protein n=1 Tax=seawater metagenome TaxID=1561972 RepID=A0A5E8CM48_9ZZZZ